MKADQLSKTAAFIAIKFYGLTRIKKYRSIFDEQTIHFYENLVRNLPSPLSRYHNWLKKRWVRKFCMLTEELFLPGDLMHIIARKWYIQNMTDNLIDQGCRQVLVLGAGFDHLAFYCSQKSIRCWEIESPFMAQFKRNFFQTVYPDKITPQIIDLQWPEDQLGPMLQRHPEIKADKFTLIIAEGFFDYLDFQTVSRVLEALRNYFLNDPVLISTHFAVNELPGFNRQVFRKSVRMVGEKLKFHVSMAEFEKLLEKHDFTIKQRHDYHHIQKKMQALVDTSQPVLKGFYIIKSA